MVAGPNVTKQDFVKVRMTAARLAWSVGARRCLPVQLAWGES